MHVEFIEQLSTIKPEHWNKLAGDTNPFIQHAFLSALEKNNCLHEYGWHPQHLLIYEETELVAAMPMYIKDNSSYGELVFDGAWADAYHRSGVPYYPKLVTAIPYTPATGPRLLVSPDYSNAKYKNILIEETIRHAQTSNMSSIHWLFTNENDNDTFKQFDLPMRLGCQFHWHNKGYKSFEDYLSNLVSQKRKKIKRERKRVQEQEVLLEIRHGHEMTEELWHIFHNFYSSTFDRKSGIPTLSLEFFQEIGATMPQNVVIVFAKFNNEYVASAFNMRGHDTLYGRHWGCSAKFHSLHFEACYYQGLDYCIKQGLDRFEPGAQGEHKISRGFLPTPTWSAHWIANPGFKQAINDFVNHEKTGMQYYINSLKSHSPFKTEHMS